MKRRISIAIAVASLCVAISQCRAIEIVEVASGRGPQSPKQPQASVGSDGSVHVVFGIGDAVQHCRSVDGGRNFEKIRQAFRVPNLSLGMRRGPRIVNTQDAIVVSAIGGRIGKGRDGDVLAWRSSDDGLTWQGPVAVNDAADSAREGLHAMACGPDGSIWCVWLDLRDKQSEIYAAKSADNGATWEPNVCVYRSPDGSVCECCHPSVLVETDAVHVLFRNSLAGNRDMYVTSSSDRGKSFSQARKLGSGTWMLNACPMDGGMLAAGADGTLETVWRRDGEIYTSKGDGSSEVLLGRGQQPWIASIASGPVVVWTSGQEGELLIREPGSEESRRLSQGARDAMVASAPDGAGPAVCCWESKRGEDAVILLHRIDAEKGKSPKRP